MGQTTQETCRCSTRILNHSVSQTGKATSCASGSIGVKRSMLTSRARAHLLQETVRPFLFLETSTTEVLSTKNPLRSEQSTRRSRETESTGSDGESRKNRRIITTRLSRRTSSETQAIFTELHSYNTRLMEFSPEKGILCSVLSSLRREWRTYRNGFLSVGTTTRKKCLRHPSRHARTQRAMAFG